MNRQRIGVTGQNGFIGYHLLQTIKLYPEDFESIKFDRSYFNNSVKLDQFVSNCDVIIHLAGLNRHNNPQEIYDTNISLTKDLIESLNRTGSSPQVIFSSSTQEENDNHYGKSKLDSRKLLELWAQNSEGKFCGFLIPNVCGPFGVPNYNSVVATFCHQLAFEHETKIQVDGELKLIYVSELVEYFIKAIKTKSNKSSLQIPYSMVARVSEILSLLKEYKQTYQNLGVIPKINSLFEHQLFNTFRCYMPKKDYFPRHFVKHEDQRGHFVELARMGIGGQMSFSTTKTGITRGNHFHTRKIERFAVIKGKAKIQLRKIGTPEVLNFHLDGDKPSYVDMPIWYTHNITNIGEEELITVFWINEAYCEEDSDTWFEKV
jgi:UDP-2-acetamido-2,6-beta-L-arabino-hexul-4-ose reductase